MRKIKLVMKEESFRQQFNHILNFNYGKPIINILHVHFCIISVKPNKCKIIIICLWQRQVSVATQMVREHGRSAHKRSTLELLVRAKTLTAASNALPQPSTVALVSDVPAPGYHHHPHRFEKYNYPTPAYCDHCSSVLWGPIKVRDFLNYLCSVYR